MKVSLAVQVLSHSVAAAMTTYTSLNALQPAAGATIEVIDMFDKLFDLFNSSKTSASKTYNRAFKGESYQRQFLNNALSFFKKVVVLDKNNKNLTSKIKSIRCWQISINALLSLWDFLQSEGFDFLLTRRLCQDALENFFGAVRKQGGNCINPTPIQFHRAFKKLFTLNLFNSGSENCAEDFESILSLTNSELASQQIYEPVVLTQIIGHQLSLKDCDYSTAFNELESNSIRYMWIPN